MRHRILAVLLGIGAIAGFASGLHSVRHHHHGPWHGGWKRGRHGHSEFEERVADVCARAAEQVYRERGRSDARAAP